MNNDKFQPIPNRSEIIPDVETFRVTEGDTVFKSSYFCDGTIKLPNGTEIKAIILYILVDDEDEIFIPIEYIER